MKKIYDIEDYVEMFNTLSAYLTSETKEIDDDVLSAYAKIRKDIISMLDAVPQEETESGIKITRGDYIYSTRNKKVKGIVLKSNDIVRGYAILVSCADTFYVDYIPWLEAEWTGKHVDITEMLNIIEEG